MSKRSITLTDALYQYLLDVSLREPPVLAELRAETAKLPSSGMQISPEQGQFMALLVRMLGARRGLEVGTFTGYSSLVLALAVPELRLTCCDVNPDYTKVARRYWERTGVADRIELRLAPALETLDALLADGQAGQFDFCFIDADKGNYDGYYERALTLLRPGGLIAVDNVLWSGAVIKDEDVSEDTQAIRDLNEKIHRDQRVQPSLVPIGDGLTLALKL